jgi:hypothetical protein
MKFNNDPEWLRRMADAEDGCDCTVGVDFYGLTPPFPTEEQLAWLFRMRAQAEGREIRVDVPPKIIEVIDAANRTD